MNTLEEHILAARSGDLEVDLHVWGDDRVTAVTFRPDETEDPDLDLAVRQELEKSPSAPGGSSRRTRSRSRGRP